MRTELAFLATPTVLSSLLGILLFCYLLYQDVAGIKNSAYWGFTGIIIFLFIILLNYFYSSYFNLLQCNHFIDLNYINDLTNESAIQCIACIILSFSFHIVLVFQRTLGHLATCYVCAGCVFDRVD